MAVREVNAFLQKEADSRIAEEEGALWNDLMRYTVAIDSDGVTSSAFMEAAGESGIPTAFVVGLDGKIEWIGHPMAIDEPLEQIAAGTWDREILIAQRKEEQHLTNIKQQLTESFRKQDWEQALQLIEEHSEDIPDAAILKLSILIKAERTSQAVPLLEKITQQYDGDAEALYALSWSIASYENSPEPLLRGALNAAERANVLTGYSNGGILDALARVHQRLGDLEEAIAWQTRAVEADPEVDQLRETLEEYKAQTESNESADAAAVPTS